MLHINLFPSIGLTICGLVFLSLITLMYLSKKKYDSLENTIYRFLLILTMILLVIELCFVIAMGKVSTPGIINEVLARLYILGCIVWFTCLIFYIWSLGKKGISKEKEKKYKQRISIIWLIIDSVFFVISCLLPVSYIGGNNDLYVIGGEAVYVLYLIGFVIIIVLLFALLNNKGDIPLKQKLPLYFAFILFVGTTAIQWIVDYDFNDLTYIFTVAVVAMYFTIESQDNKLLNELEKAKDKAVLADKAKTEFLSNMSHEIRTPLNTILGFSESLLNEKKLTKEIVKRDTESIHDASVSLLDLINNILDISRIESGKESVEEKEYQLESLVFEIDSVISSKINKDSLEFKINVNENLPSVFYGDQTKIYKIIVLTLINAIKYTNYGKITLDVDGQVSEDVCFLSFVVSNTGHAMKTEDFEKDFNDFVKLGNSTQNNIDSTTLGLIVAKRLTIMLGGEMEFKNETGKGTRYFITIKQKVTSFDKIGNVFEGYKKNDSSNTKLLNLSNKSVLIVDDNSVNIKLTSRMLSQYNFKISSAKSGFECLEMIKENKYDLIFLDHMMPEMDGVTTMKLLIKSGYSIPPVVALTANSYDGLKEKYIKEGFSDYLSKPINFKELNKLIVKYFGQKDE